MTDLPRRSTAVRLMGGQQFPSVLRCTDSQTWVIVTWSLRKHHKWCPYWLYSWVLIRLVDVGLACCVSVLVTAGGDVIGAPPPSVVARWCTACCPSCILPRSRLQWFCQLRPVVPLGYLCCLGADTWWLWVDFFLAPVLAWYRKCPSSSVIDGIFFVCLFFCCGNQIFYQNVLPVFEMVFFCIEKKPSGLIKTDCANKV